jgi:hypothetical protein
MGIIRTDLNMSVFDFSITLTDIKSLFLYVLVYIINHRNKKTELYIHYSLSFTSHRHKYIFEHSSAQGNNNDLTLPFSSNQVCRQDHNNSF